MKTQSLISASLLAADWASFGEEAKAVLAAGADWLHVDVMDNHYVPNLSFGPALCSALRGAGIQAHLDVHLMTKSVDNLILAFAKAGANGITIHPESTAHLHRSLQLIRAQGCRAGLALNPSTPLTVLDWIMPDLDMILIMTVNPGFSGQDFIPGLLDKIRAVRQRIQAQSPSILLQVDGGLQASNLAAVAEAGADVFVIGSHLFQAKSSYEATIKDCRKALDSAKIK